MKSIPDISNWNTSNVEKMKSMFENCSSLISLPDISKWDIKNVKEMKDMFKDCSKSIEIPTQILK